MPLFAFALITVLAASGIALWAVFGLPGLLAMTYPALELCHSLFERCTAYYDFLKVAFLWSGAILASAGLFYAVFMTALRVIRAYRAVAALPVRDRGGAIVLIKDDSAMAAFTHGLLRPRVYLSEGLLKRLTREELRGVFLHELHHKKRLDPLKSVLISFLRDAFFYMPALRDLGSHIQEKKERSADSAALKGVSPLDLAGALVKIAARNKGMEEALVSIRGAGDLSKRVSWLLGGEEPAFGRPRVRSIAISLAVALALGMTLLWPIGSPAASSQCSTGHCSTHVEKLDKSCKLHCSLADKAHKGHIH